MSGPVVFLLGPPGVGKSTVGGLACKRLGLRFLDLPDETPRSVAALDVAVAEADIVAVPWALQAETAVLRHARRLGTTVALWAHPETMRARASRPVTFTPRRGLSTHAGFGRHGTSCLQYRRLERTCDYTLDLEGHSELEAATELEALIVEVRWATASGARLSEVCADLERGFRGEAGAGPAAAKSLSGAMARFLLEREQAGASPRSQNALWSDLSAAAMLVFMYESPQGENVLDCFRGHAPFASEFQRKFTDSPTLVAQYERNLGAFARFLASTRIDG